MKMKLSAILLIVLMGLPLPSMAFNLTLSGLAQAIVADVGGQVLGPVAKRVWENATASTPAFSRDPSINELPTQQSVAEPPLLTTTDGQSEASAPSDQPR